MASRINSVFVEEEWEIEAYVTSQQLQLELLVEVRQNPVISSPW